MAKDIIRLDEARKPDFTEKQQKFAADLIGLGLTRLTIISLVLGKSTTDLNHAEVNSGNRLMDQQRKALGYGIMDARRCQSPAMSAAVSQVAKKYRIQIKIA